jgi:hypothetical protein
MDSKWAAFRMRLSHVFLAYAGRHSTPWQRLPLWSRRTNIPIPLKIHLRTPSLATLIQSQQEDDQDALRAPGEPAVCG